MGIRRHAITAVGLALAALAGTQLAAAEGARIHFDTSALEKQAKNVVNVTITPQTIEWALQAMGAKGQDVSEARQALKGIEQVMVRVLEFDAVIPAEQLAKVADPVLAQLKGSGWTPVVAVSENNKDGRETVNVSLFTDAAGKPGGLAVLVCEPKELVIVNIAGPVDLAKLSELAKVMDLPDIPGVPGAKAHKDKAKDKAKDKDKDKDED